MPCKRPCRQVTWPRLVQAPPTPFLPLLVSCSPAHHSPLQIHYTWSHSMLTMRSCHLHPPPGCAAVVGSAARPCHRLRVLRQSYATCAAARRQASLARGRRPVIEHRTTWWGCARAHMQCGRVSRIMPPSCAILPMLHTHDSTCTAVDFESRMAHPTWWLPSALLSTLARCGPSRPPERALMNTMSGVWGDRGQSSSGLVPSRYASGTLCGRDKFSCLTQWL